MPATLNSCRKEAPIAAVELIADGFCLLRSALPIFDQYRILGPGNILDNQLVNGERTAHFGNRFDFVVRQRLLQSGGFIVTVVPRGTVFTKDLEGGQIGGSIGAQYGSDSNSR